MNNHQNTEVIIKSASVPQSVRGRRRDTWRWGRVPWVGRRSPGHWPWLWGRGWCDWEVSSTESWWIVSRALMSTLSYWMSCCYRRCHHRVFPCRRRVQEAAVQPAVIPAPVGLDTAETTYWSTQQARSINQPTNQPTKRSINPSINQEFKKWPK